MKCSFCQTENDDNAVFCVSCGKRIDGKTVCPVCGALCEAGSTSCASCGAELPVTEPAPAPEPVAEPAAEPVAAPAPAAEPAVTYTGWRKALYILSGVVALILIIFTSILMFTVGLAQDSLFPLMSLVDGIIGMVSGPGADFGIPAMMSLSFQISIMLASWITAFVLFIVGCVRASRHFRGKEKKPIGGTAVKLYLTYALYASTLLLLNGYTDGGSPVQLNLITTVWLICGLVLLAIYAACRVAMLGKRLIEPPVICKLVICSVTILLTALVWGLCASDFILVGLHDAPEKSYTLLTLLYEYDFAGTSGQFGASVAMFSSIFGTICCIIFFGLAHSLIESSFRAITEPPKKWGLGAAITMLVFSIAIFLCAFFACSAWLAYNGVVDGLYADFPIAIAIIPISLVIMIAVILAKVLCKKLSVPKKSEP